MLAICKIKHEVRDQDANKARGISECFILRIAIARLCLNCFKESTPECLVKAYPFQTIIHPSTLSSWVRRF